MNYIIVSLIAYALGNLTGAIILGKLILNQDIRDYGSGNPGTANAMRTFGLKIGILTFALDFAKGILAVVIGSLLAGSVGMLLAALMVVIGHDWPILYKFKGGKGIATSAGALMALDWRLTLVLLAIFFTIAIISKYISLGSVLVALASPVFAYLIHGTDIWFIATISLLALMTIYKHKDNIKRLLAGNESKFSISKKHAER